MTLNDQALAVLNTKFSSVVKKSTRPIIWEIESKKCNVRSASKKSGDKYWFDVTPYLYEKAQVDFFIYICGTPDIIYFFPCEDFKKLIEGAHLGGQKQVPNFTIYDNSYEFEPAGLSYNKHNIYKYRNNFKIILPKIIDTVIYPDEVKHPSLFPEGATKNISINYYERNPKAREECLKHYGYSCSVCSFNFEKAYGEIGKNFIHVHHLMPLHEITKRYEVSPIKDLRPVCPNCHAMLHKRKECLSISELKEKLANEAKKGQAR